MKLLLLLAFFFGVSTNAFTVESSYRRTLTVRTPQADGSYATTHLFMFDNDSPPKPLESADAPPVTPSTAESSNVVKDLNTGEVKEVKWVDPAMSANTNVFNMGWWASALFVVMPVTLLFNDLAKATNGAGFLPTDGPLGFFGRL